MRKYSGVAGMSVICFVLVTLSVWLWPRETVDLAPFVSPVTAQPGPPVPQQFLSVGPGQALGREAIFDTYRLEPGWQLARTADYGRFDLVARVTNFGDDTGIARVQAQIYNGEKMWEYLTCRVTLDPGETKLLICADTADRDYTTHWNRLTLYTS